MMLSKAVFFIVILGGLFSFTLSAVAEQSKGNEGIITDSTVEDLEQSRSDYSDGDLLRIQEKLGIPASIDGHQQDLPNVKVKGKRVPPSPGAGGSFDGQSAK